MSIWSFDSVVKDEDAIRVGMELSDCLFCNSQMQFLEDEEVKIEPAHRSWSPALADGIDSFYRKFVVRICPVCGWWNAKDFTRSKPFDPTEIRTLITDTLKGQIGNLKELDLKDQSIPIEEIRSYLAAKYSSRFTIDPLKFEEVVASVYKDLGYQPRITARSGDGGIDIILDGPDDSLVGIQVKRSKNKIKAEHIRALAGALCLNGMTHGIFVTTSTFQPGAERSAMLAQIRGVPIALVDAEHFFDALGIAQREMYKTASGQNAPFAAWNLPVLSEYKAPGAIWQVRT